MINRPGVLVWTGAHLGFGGTAATLIQAALGRAPQLDFQRPCKEDRPYHPLPPAPDSSLPTYHVQQVTTKD